MPNVGRVGSSYAGVFVSKNHFGNKINESKNSKPHLLIIYIAVHTLRKSPELSVGVSMH